MPLPTRALSYRGPSDLPASQADRADLVKAIHTKFQKSIKCNCGAHFTKNGFANETYRFKCSGCKVTASCETFMNHAMEALKLKGLTSFKVDGEKMMYDVTMEFGDDLISLAGSEVERQCDLIDTTGDDHQSLSKKRKISDTSMSHDDAARFIAELSLEELRKFALDTHDRLIESERRFSELQGKLADQSAKLVSQDERLTVLERKMNNSAPQTPVDNSTERSQSQPRGGSWADVVLRNVPEERKAEVINARKALKVKPVSKPVPAKFKGETDFGVRIVYVRGIQRMRFKEVKGHLKCLGFSLSKILSISFIGFSVTEFIVDDSYAGFFISQIRSRLDNAEVLENFDPAKPITSFSVPEQARKSCVRRIQGILSREETPYAVRKVLESFVAEKELLDEMENLEETRDMEVEEIHGEGQLADLSQ